MAHIKQNSRTGFNSTSSLNEFHSEHGFPIYLFSLLSSLWFLVALQKCTNLTLDGDHLIPMLIRILWFWHLFQEFGRRMIIVLSVVTSRHTSILFTGFVASTERNHSQQINVIATIWTSNMNQIYRNYRPRAPLYSVEMNVEWERIENEIKWNDRQIETKTIHLTTQTKIIKKRWMALRASIH